MASSNGSAGPIDFWRRSPSLTVWSGYGAALAAVGLALLFRYSLRDSFGVTVPYLQFYPAIILAAWFGGLGPGVLATVVSALAAMYAFLPPAGFAVGGAENQLSLAVFVGTGVLIAWLNHRLLRTQEEQRAIVVMATARAERLDAILNTTVDGIIAIDARGTIEAFNRGAQTLFGYPESEVIGRNVSMLMPSPHHEEHDKYLERYLTTGDAKIIGIGREVTGRRRDGTLFPVHLSVGEMQIGGERKFTGMLHDLTKRARLEDELRASEARWRAVIDSAVDGIVVIDAHGRVESFNPAAERMFGYAAEEVLGRNVDMLMPSPYREEHDTYLSRYLATGRAKIIGIGREVQGRRKDGTTFPLHLSVGQITIEGERRFTGILHDLTARVADGGPVTGAGIPGQAGRDGGGDRARSEEPARRHPRRDPGDCHAYAQGGCERAGPEGDRGPHRRPRSDDEGSAVVRAAARTQARPDRPRAAGDGNGQSAEPGSGPARHQRRGRRRRAAGRRPTPTCCGSSFRIS